MALARIFSASPEHAAALIHDLERQGYRVEVILPDEIPSGPADLEIQYELCDAQHVVECANELASESQADIAIGTGVLRAAPVEPVRGNLPETVAEDDAAETRRDAVGPQEITLETEAAMPKEDRVAVFPLTSGVNVKEAPTAPHPAVEGWSGIVTRMVAFAGNSLHNAHGLWLAGVHRMREQRERAAIRVAEADARREQRLLELTCRRAEALQRSRQIEAARRAASGYLSQLQHEAAGVRTEKQPRKRNNTAPIAAYMGDKEGHVWWTPSRHVKHIAAGAAAAGAVFALTLGISALRSNPSPVKSAAPAPGPVVTVESSRITSPAVTRRPSPARGQVTEKRAPSHATHASPSRASQSDDGDVADDVVIRHFGPAKALQSRSRRSNGVKRYSDIDN